MDLEEEYGGGFGVLEGKLYMESGEEFVMKPGHMLVIGRESFAQIPIPDSSTCEFIYRPNSQPMIAHNATVTEDHWNIEVVSTKSCGKEEDEAI